MLQQKRDSKSFDSAGPLYRPENDLTTSAADNCNGVNAKATAAAAAQQDERKTKIKLPTPPVQATVLPSRSPEHKTTETQASTKINSSSAQCIDEETCDKVDDMANASGKRIEPIAEHKTTLGEAEIQNAVEAAAVIFKKVVLQRRAAKTATAIEDGKFFVFCYRLFDWNCENSSFLVGRHKLT